MTVCRRRRRSRPVRVYAGLIALFLGGPALADDPPRVVATVKPLHALTAQVMAGVARPTLLIEGGASPHVYAMRPSDALALERADIVIWTGAALETFFPRLRASMDAATAVIAVRDLAGMTILPSRAPSGEPGTAGHGPAEWDPHLWLDIDNAAAIVTGIAERLVDADPAHAEQYISNRDRALAALATLKRELAAIFAGDKTGSYVAAHDAYQYFEKDHGLTFGGAVLSHPGRPANARHLSRLRRRIAESDTACLLTEPRFRPATVEALAAETGLRIIEADPLGATLAAGAGHYRRLMRDLAAAFEDCLAGAR